jgi:PadR family transcriptional regulator AphA
VPELTTTSYALLGLLSLRPWSSYELAKQMERSLRHIWPRAESKVYEEPKKLVAAGLATASGQARGRRPRTVYAITSQGRAALATWLAEPGRGPVLEFEALLKVSFADQGSRTGLLANIDAVIADAGTKAAFGQALAEQYLAGDGPFPERLAVTSLMWRFLWEHNAAILRWARWARAEVERWPPGSVDVDGLELFRRTVAGAGLGPDGRTNDTAPADPCA